MVIVYYYRVCATNATGDSAFSNEASGTTPLAKPTSATATAVSSSQINLTWIDNSASETGYKIERKTTATGTYAQIDQVGANVQSYSDTNGLDPNTRYYYRVRATNGTIDSDVLERTVRYDIPGCSSSAIQSYNYVSSIKPGQSLLDGQL